jgi:hypothetical protein
MTDQFIPVRVAVLDTARQAITVDRAATHGDAESSFSLIAAYWSAHLDHPVSAGDVAVMMTLFKLARAKGNPKHQDNWVDAIGYSALGAEIAAGEA